MSSSIDISQTKKGNLKHNINNALKKLRPEESEDILIMRIYIENFNEYLIIEFIYMTSKTQILHKRVLSFFKSYFMNNNNLNSDDNLFNTAHIDMELALSNAIIDIFKNCKIKYCYFHFGQCFNKRLNNKVYINLFNNNYREREIIYSLKALCLIKTEFVIPVFYV